MKVVVRPCTLEDKSIILATWLKGNYWGCDYYHRMEQDLYFQEFAKKIHKILNKPGTQIDVAVLEEAPAIVLGYIIYNDQVLYWAYTKRHYRKEGILSALLANMDFEYFTGNTPIGLSIGKKKNLKYNPLLGD